MAENNRDITGPDRAKTINVPASPPQTLDQPSGAPQGAETQDGEGEGKGQGSAGRDLFTGMPEEVLKNICRTLDPRSLAALRRTSFSFKKFIAGSHATSLWHELCSAELSVSSSANLQIGSAAKHMLTFYKACISCHSNGGIHVIWELYGRACERCFSKNTISLEGYTGYHREVDQCVLNVGSNESGKKLYWKPILEKVSDEMYNIQTKQVEGALGIFNNYILEATERVALAARGRGALKRLEDGEPAAAVLQPEVSPIPARSPPSDRKLRHQEKLLQRRNSVEKKLMEELGYKRHEFLALDFSWRTSPAVNTTRRLTESDWKRIKPDCVKMLEDQRAGWAACRAKVAADKQVAAPLRRASLMTLYEWLQKHWNANNGPIPSFEKVTSLRCLRDVWEPLNMQHRLATAIAAPEVFKNDILSELLGK